MSTSNPSIFPGIQGLAIELLRQTKTPKPGKHDETKAIDVVAVHGLMLWEFVPGFSFWLCDFVAKDIRGARVFIFNYDPKAL